MDCFLYDRDPHHERIKVNHTYFKGVEWVPVVLSIAFVLLFETIVILWEFFLHNLSIRLFTVG